MEALNIWIAGYRLGQSCPGGPDIQPVSRIITDVGDAWCLPSQPFLSQQHCQRSHPRFLNPLNIQWELRHHSRVFNHYPSLGLNAGNQQEKKTPLSGETSLGGWRVGERRNPAPSQSLEDQFAPEKLFPEGLFGLCTSTSFTTIFHLPQIPGRAHWVWRCSCFWMNSWVNTQTWSHSCHVSF